MMESIEIHEAATPARTPVVDLTADTPPYARGEPTRKQGAGYAHSGPNYSPASSGVYIGGNTLSDVSNRSNVSAGQSSRGYNFDSFGSSLSQKSRTSKLSYPYSSYIKPATPNAFQKPQSRIKQTFSQPARQPAFGTTKGYVNGWPAWVQPGGVNPGTVPNARAPLASTSKAPVEDDVPRENFDIAGASITADDMVRYNGDAEKHMAELLSGAIGDGEDEMGDDGIQEGDDKIEGFAKGMKLMPHQVRGVKWMRQRESGRKYGGILADDMGLGKTVQTLARIVEGKPTPAEKKAGYKGGTLIICPLAVMEQWATECNTKTSPGVLKVTTHHTSSRTKLGKTLEGYDVVITTFATVSSEFGIYEKEMQSRLDDQLDSDSDDVAPKGRKKAVKKKATMSALFQVKWLRIVVDEAQNIKNRNTKQAKAAVALRAKYRWCLTGTPIQNNVEELFTLFQFLRARPLDDWQEFRIRISALVKEGRTKIAMKRLHVVLKAIMLRHGKKILNLPGRTVQVMPCPFDEDERAFYEALEKKTSITFNKFVKSGSATANYTSVLTLLLRLRQACVHPSLVTNSLDMGEALEADDVAKAAPVKDEADELADMLGGLGVAKGKTCSICFVKLQDQTATHCAGCIGLTERVSARDKSSNLPPDSAKIRTLLKLLSEIDEKSGGQEKTIVFSQFTTFLNLVEPFLKKHKIAFVRYDGSMRNDKRQQSLQAIKNDPVVKVILISFKAGSTGLNLTCCNNVVLMDLWWNPALEDQAFDRAHRLGQKRDVNIYKLTIEETVEDRILALQNNKRELSNAALSGQAGKGLMKLTMDDIMKLFKHSHKGQEDDESDDDD
ncbi:hypothetical protein I350_04889 [Cryptococcus amylolentus CBS 6273]|uniref:DNA repair protein RAD5 n=1 Tax=Cryptococcus amylolentus CBS 6273 TaxID=1296118 RepID=A0A1E3JY71_9TREE|nr:hypothetical protein I350_04889 [Cryptococcus amylolentus CBS 6273]